MLSRINMSQVAAVVVSISLLSGSLPSQALASEQTTEPTQAVLRVAKPTVAKRVKFDWLAQRGNRNAVTLVSEVRPPQQIGSGSWICSPAGFGKKSRCYAN